jgi:hypothetical protein
MTSNATEKRKDAIILHRLTCPKSAHILDWFHSAALRSVPEAGMLRALGPNAARHIRRPCAPDTPGCPTTTLKSQDILPYADICKPYLEMLVAPSKHCDKEKPASCRAVHRALDILLRFQLDDDIAALPDLDTFGPAPSSNALATINFPCEPHG